MSLSLDIKTACQLGFNVLMFVRGFKEPPQDLSMESTAEILSRLKFLGQIQKNEKIFTKGLTKQPDGWLTRFSRSFVAPDNRVNTLKFVRDVISRSFDILLSSITHSDEKKIDCRSVVKDLIKAQHGLSNLKETYIEDLKFCCDMDVFIEQIVFRLTEIKAKHPDLFTPTPSLSPVISREEEIPPLLENV